MTDEPAPAIDPVQVVLISEMVALRRSLRWERRHKRALYVAVCVLLLLAALMGDQFFRLRHTVRQVNDTVVRVDSDAAADEARQVVIIRDICQAWEGGVNTIVESRDPPRTEAQRWQQQAQLDAFVSRFETENAALGCTLHPNPVPDVPGR